MLNKIIFIVIHSLSLIYKSLNSSNCLSMSLLHSKLHCLGSTFASNYRHLSYKYNVHVCEEDWFSGLSHLKVNVRFAKVNKSCTYSTQVIHVIEYDKINFKV